MSNKKLFVFGIIGLVICGVFVWLSRYGYVEISVKNSSGGSITYTLSDQNGQNVITGKSSSLTIKRMVPKADYEVLVSQNETSFFSLNKTRGFLGVTKIEAELRPEKSREYVGNTPGFCMHYNQTTTTLFSYNCNGTYTELSIHEQATEQEPTYTVSPESPDAALRGIVQLDGSSYALVDGIQSEEGVQPTKSLYRLRDDLLLNEWVELPALDRNKIWYVQNYRQGFIAYDDTFRQIKYFSDLRAKPINISTDTPSDNVLEPVSLRVNDNSIDVLYAEKTPHNDEGLDDSEEAESHSTPEGRSEVIIYKDNKIKHVELDRVYSSALTCGDQKLCTLGNEQLDVYDISSKQPKKLFSINEVNAIEKSGKTLLVAQKDKVVGFDVDNKTGTIQFSYGKSAFCGIQAAKGGYVLCIVDEKGDSSALLIEPGVPNNDSIDKKISKLGSIPEVAKLSVYGTFIYVSPNGGELVYRSEIQGYGFSPGVVRAANQAINQQINELGIDRTRYTIINPYQ